MPGRSATPHGVCGGWTPTARGCVQGEAAAAKSDAPETHVPCDVPLRRRARLRRGYQRAVRRACRRAACAAARRATVVQRAQQLLEPATTARLGLLDELVQVGREQPRPWVAHEDGSAERGQQPHALRLGEVSEGGEAAALAGVERLQIERVRHARKPPQPHLEGGARHLGHPAEEQPARLVDHVPSQRGRGLLCQRAHRDELRRRAPLCGLRRVRRASPAAPAAEPHLHRRSCARGDQRAEG